MAAPTRAKKRLGAFLAELRNRAETTAVKAAKELRTSDSTVSRYESGQVLPIWSTVLTLLRLYKVPEEDQAVAARLWEDANDEPPSVRLPVGTHKSFRRLVNAEREAETERAIELSTMPGLLQTQRYAWSLVEAAHRFGDPVRVEAVIATRLTRQKRLTGPDPLALHALIDEAAIVREVGGKDVMREQLAHLLVVGARPNITLQVVPFVAGAYGTMSGSCIILNYPEAEEPPGVYLEYPAGGAWVDSVDDVRRFTAMFDDVAALALSPEATADLIHQRIKALEDR